MTTAVGFTNSANSNLHTANSSITAKSSNCSVSMFAMMSGSTGNNQMLWQLNGVLSALGHSLYYDNTTSKTLVYKDPSGSVLITTTNITLGQWYFIGMSALGTNVTVFIKPVGAPTCSTFSTSSSTTFGPNNIWIGNEEQSSNVMPWLGSICSVKIWSNTPVLTTTGVTLTQEEMERESEQIFPVRTADLRYWFPLTGTSDLYSNTTNQIILTSGSAALSQTIGPPIPEHRVYSNPPYDIYW